MTTINTTLKPESMKFFHETLDMLLKDNSSTNMSKYNDITLSRLMDYLTRFVKFNTLSEDDLNKLISIHAKFSYLYCTENLNNSSNQTASNSYSDFTKFSNAIRDLESFFNPLDNINQTRLKESCASTLNSDASTSFSIAAKVAATVGHGAVAGTSNAVTAIALESAKNKGYTGTQLRLLKAGSVVFNSLVIASYASMASTMENSNESYDALTEKMWQSFALSLTSTTSLYALAHGINYFAKSVENKLVKGFLNALPLAGNVCLLVKGGNSLTESAAIIGTNVATAGIVTTAIQTGWNFFSKRRNTEENFDIELGVRSNVVETASSSPSTEETPFYTNGDISSNNAIPVYDEINEVAYYNTENDEDEYLNPNVLNQSINSASGPALPERNREDYENHRFFGLKQGRGILVSTACIDDTANLTAASQQVLRNN